MPHIPGHPADDPMIINEDEGLATVKDPEDLLHKY